MAGFPIFQLNSTHLEKVVKKVEKQSYFRLQQVCREMAELVRSNRHIWMSLEWNVECFWEMSNGKLDIFINAESVYPVDVESVYGVRFASLSIIYDDDAYTQHFVKLLQIIKPEMVSLSGSGLTQWKILPTWKGLKELSLTVGSEDAISVLEIIPQVAEVTLVVQSPDNDLAFCDASQFHEVLVAILEFLCSGSHLRVFRCDLYCDQGLPSAEEQLPQLQDFHPIFLREETESGIMKHVYQCSLNQRGPAVELALFRNVATIKYRRVEPNP